MLQMLDVPIERPLSPFAVPQLPEALPSGQLQLGAAAAVLYCVTVKFWSWCWESVVRGALRWQAVGSDVQRRRR